MIVLASALATGHLYLTYPRHDAVEAGHGYNVSQADIDAVWLMESEAKGQNYLVLANQSVSAAAIQELGFNHYFGDQFFYPIPTGGNFYQQFLAMNAQPSREIAFKAIQLVEPSISTLFYVVNSYWWESQRIIETAKTNADAWWSVGDGAVSIFVYTFDE